MLKVEIVTPERLVRTAEGDEVTLPTIEGQIGILKGHIPLIVPLTAGEIVVKRKDGSRDYFAVAGGFVEVLSDTVRIMADSAEHSDELDELIVKDAVERAECLKSEATETIQFADAAAQLETNLARLKVIQRKKAHSKSRIDLE